MLMILHVLDHCIQFIPGSIERGPMYGYFSEPTKSVVIVASKYVEIAKSIFQKVEVNSTSLSWRCGW